MRIRVTAVPTMCSTATPAFRSRLASSTSSVARRAGIRAEGVNFPGHFLVRALQDLHTDDPNDGLIVDPFVNEGAILNEQDCRRLLRHQMGNDAAWEPELLARDATAGSRSHAAQSQAALCQWRSFPQARMVTDLLLTPTPNPVTELRDRGLLAYHMNDFPAAPWISRSI